MILNPKLYIHTKIHMQASEQGVKMLAIKCEHSVDVDSKGKAVVHFTGTMAIDLGYRARLQQMAVEDGVDSRRSKKREHPKQTY